MPGSVVREDSRAFFVPFVSSVVFFNRRQRRKTQKLYMIVATISALSAFSAVQDIKNPLNPFNPMFKIKSPMMNDVRIISHLSPIFAS